MIYLILLIILSLNSNIYGVSTKYINDFKYDNFESFKYSNITFIQNYGFELSKESELYFTNSDMIWCLEKYDKNFLIGCGDIATVILKNNYTNFIIFQNSNYLMVTDIKILNNQIYISVLPSGSIYVLSKDYKITKKIEMSNQYVWQMIPYNNSLLVLTGNPAEIYIITNNNLFKLFRFDYEDNILNGVIIKNYLYFICDDQNLYRIELDKISNKSSLIIVSTYNNNINSLFEYNGALYLTISGKEYTVKQTTGSQQEDVMVSQMKGKQSNKGKSETKSALYRYTSERGSELIYENNKLVFNTTVVYNNNFFIGTDKDGGYIEIDNKGNLIKYSSFGEGRFIKIKEYDGNLFAVLLDPPRIIKINTNYSKYGYFISSPFNTSLYSKWGIPIVNQSIYDKCYVKIYTRTGATLLEDFWEEWRVIDNFIKSSPNQFIQYKVELYGTSDKSPLFKSIVIPYVDYNLPPIIKQIKYNYNNNIFRFLWECYDENNDIVTYNVFIKNTNEINWIKLNDKSIEENYYEINKDNFPEGFYNIYVIASDENSNPDGTGLSNYIISDIFQIENTPPIISEIKYKVNEKSVTFDIEDKNSYLQEVAYSINGKKWIRILPIDNILDSNKESFYIKIEKELPCFIQIRAVDIFGNSQTRGIYLR